MDDVKVELWCAGIPIIGMAVVHHWFVTECSGKRDRFEVWNQENVGGYSVGHLHRNLIHPDISVGRNPSLVHSWAAETAEELIRVLNNSFHNYPYLHHYRSVPGPNSNTFVAWVLLQVHIEHKLCWKAFGESFAKKSVKKVV